MGWQWIVAFEQGKSFATARRILLVILLTGSFSVQAGESVFQGGVRRYDNTIPAEDPVSVGSPFGGA